MLILLSLFVPLIARSHDTLGSLQKACPLLFISMCTFIANDIDDLERDRINHPNRPLPSGGLTTTFAVLLYFACLAFALLATKHFTGENSHFYYILLNLTISYRYVTEYFPTLKAPYVAALAAAPLLLAAAYYPETKIIAIACSTFLFMLGRELCMDIRDRAGDERSLLHRISPTTIASCAFGCEAVAIVILLVQAKESWEWLAALLVIILYVYAAWAWRNSRSEFAVLLMKFQMFAGLGFLF